MCPVTTAEEMPVNETSEMYQQLRDNLRMPLGVLFVNRPFRGESPRLVDLAPTILAALGVPKGPAMEGSSLLP